ncbi:hypothetical protein [Oceanobacter mangrovi]|uniref:hypothetical protein n=1 Tax=Oceanobacter mangrovi TaxID=2862510 RepID=UPI001C8DBA5D|nr:hypothetical protein [Oceanobacter mangrovi]
MHASRIARVTTVLMVISATLLSAMIPGGPVETRDFSAYSPVILGSFNTFLTLLGLLSYGTAWFTWRRQRWALICASLCGAGYFMVYAADLVQLFPQSPIAMPAALLVMEVIGLVLAVPLLILPLLIKADGGPQQGYLVHHSRNLYLSAIAVFCVVVAIVAFATISAMGSK